MGFVHLHHPATGGLAQFPEELLDHWADLGWVPVPDGVNLNDPEAVAALLNPSEDLLGAPEDPAGDLTDPTTDESPEALDSEED